MRRVAARRVYISVDNFFTNHVVELAGERVVNHYPLRQEQAMTEWLGSVIILTRHTTLPPLDTSLDTLMETLRLTETDCRHLRAFHITEVHLESGSFSDRSRIIPIVEKGPDDETPHTR